MKLASLVLLLSFFSAVQTFASSPQYCGIKVKTSSVAIPSADFEQVLDEVKADSEIKKYTTCNLNDGSKVIVMMGKKIDTSALIFRKKSESVEIDADAEIYIHQIAEIFLIDRPFLINCNATIKTCFLGSKNSSRWYEDYRLYADLTSKGLSMSGLYQLEGSTVSKLK